MDFAKATQESHAHKEMQQREEERQGLMETEQLWRLKFEKLQMEFDEAAKRWQAREELLLKENKPSVSIAVNELISVFGSEPQIKRIEIADDQASGKGHIQQYQIELGSSSENGAGEHLVPPGADTYHTIVTVTLSFQELDVMDDASATADEETLCQVLENTLSPTVLETSANVQPTEAITAEAPLTHMDQPSLPELEQPENLTTESLPLGDQEYSSAMNTAAEESVKENEDLTEFIEVSSPESNESTTEAQDEGAPSSDAPCVTLNTDQSDLKMEDNAEECPDTPAGDCSREPMVPLTPWEKFQQLASSAKTKKKKKKKKTSKMPHDTVGEALTPGSRRMDIGLESVPDASGVKSPEANSNDRIEGSTDTRASKCPVEAPEASLPEPNGTSTEAEVSQTKPEETTQKKKRRNRMYRNT